MHAVSMLYLLRDFQPLCTTRLGAYHATMHLTNEDTHNDCVQDSSLPVSLIGVTYVWSQPPTPKANVYFPCLYLFAA